LEAKAQKSLMRVCRSQAPNGAKSQRLFTMLFWDFVLFPSLCAKQKAVAPLAHERGKAPIRMA
jgi:hypothetical protein